MENSDNCKYCGAEINEEAGTGSLHIWEIEYLCGASIIGAIGSDEDGEDYKECPNKDTSVTKKGL